jgi:hypothetical protein
MGLKITSFSLNLPFGIGGVSVVRTEAQVRAAWSLYVEFATRIATQPLEPDQGSPREALTSLHQLFEATRTVLKEQGPGVAEGPESVGPLAIRILNHGVRPFLVRWHTKLGAFEKSERAHQQSPGRDVQPATDEGKWPESDAFYADLDDFRLSMLAYVEALGELAGVGEER